MTPEKKRKLRNIALLALLGLIGGTFAFTAFNQQAINDRLRENPAQVGGRVHDYFNRDTENKDVFVENFGQEPIMVRLRLSEFMEIQERGQSSFTPVVEGTSRANTQGWPYYIPAGDSLMTRTGAGAAFNIYSNLTFGWEGNGTAPWYLPTFNTVYNDDRTAAAGDARDYEADGTTHPGTGRADQWTEGGFFDNSNNDYPGAGVTRHTAQTLPEDREPMTLQEWLQQGTNQVGNFWVIDHETGWAYWANQLNGGQATSYLLDAAQMLSAADNINGSYYYAIHVESDLISVNEEFQGEQTMGAARALLLMIRASGTGNPAPETVAHAKAFNFSRMSDTAGANTRFTVANPDGTGAQMFRYLEHQGSDNHLIIHNAIINRVIWDEQEEALKDWYDVLPQDLQTKVAPVASSFETGSVPRGFPSNQQGGLVTWDGWWSVAGLDRFPDAEGDITEVDPNGIPRAFSLSLADVQRLSIGITETGFLNNSDRLASLPHRFWHLRTPSLDPRQAWRVGNLGQLEIGVTWHPSDHVGIRPALIIHQ
ncbi:hypothetical protein [Lactococcus petauri]|uniref:hypothetical protein n=1 Tax=Lactococcus petauri TaxID=1940789 RepID=UPI00254D136D|nr:hypothetical protein [Lactococcus petauri]